MNFTFDNYNTEGFFDEMFTSDGQIRSGYTFFKDRVEQLTKEEFMRRQISAERALMAMGITFNVYSENEGTERIMPVDIIPRIVSAKEWEKMEKGLIQRITALNLFLADIYSDQKIIKDGIIPKEVIYSSKNFLEPCMGIKPPKNIWIHITGTDLIRGNDGEYMVLEDNLRCPSGVSYMMENRELLKQTFPEVVAKTQIRPIADYPHKLLQML